MLVVKVEKIKMIFESVYFFQTRKKTEYFVEADESIYFVLNFDEDF